MPVQGPGSKNPAPIKNLPVDDTVGVDQTKAAPAATSVQADAKPVGLDAATGANQSPASGGAVLGGGAPGAGGIPQLQGQDFLKGAARPGLFATNPGHEQGTVSLEVVLKQLEAQHGPKVVEQIAGFVKAKTGMEIPPAALAAAGGKPERLLNMLAFSPAEMKAGLRSLNLAHQAGKIDDMAMRKHFLPEGVDAGKLGEVSPPEPTGKAQELAPGLYYGVDAAPLSDTKKRDMATAEIFDRLMRNADKPADERFSVKYNGGEFTRVDTFLEALQADGHDVEVKVFGRVANFAELSVDGPGGSRIDVAAPLMVKTGVKDQLGNEAVVPSIHSELVINVRPTADTKGPGLDGEFRFYQGVPNTGFHAGDRGEFPPWTGGIDGEVWSGKDAIRAVELAGLLGDVIRTVAEEKGMYMSGYGETGVCNDSVAIIQHLMTGKATMYPLLMTDDALLEEVAKRLLDGNRQDRPEYRMIGQAIRDLLSDLKPNDTLLERIESSVPWKPGEEVLLSTAEARGILDKAADDGADIVIEED